MGELVHRFRWHIAIGVPAIFAVLCVWLILTDAPIYRLVLRLYYDKPFLRTTLQEWGVLAPVLFIAIQALQVVISPVPGEATGFLGGFLFGLSLGFVYSTIGLALGSIMAFGVGRWLGAHFVRSLVSKANWQRLGFIIEAEGAILCFIVYLIPGFPKDIVCYLFGMSPMPLWVFALVSTLGRMPGTWVLSAQGSKTATGHYIEAALLTAVVVAVALPLYYYRHRIVAFFGGRSEADAPDPKPRRSLDSRPERPVE